MVHAALDAPQTRGGGARGRRFCRAQAAGFAGLGVRCSTFYLFFPRGWVVLRVRFVVVAVVVAVTRWFWSLGEGFARAACRMLAEVVSCVRQVIST